VGKKMIEENAGTLPALNILLNLPFWRLFRSTAIRQASLNTQHFIFILAVGEGEKGQICFLVSAGKMPSGKRFKCKNRVAGVQYDNIRIQKPEKSDQPSDLSVSFISQG